MDWNIISDCFFCYGYKLECILYSSNNVVSFIYQQSLQCFCPSLFHFTDSPVHSHGKTCHFDLTVKNNPRVICQRQTLNAGQNIIS